MAGSEKSISPEIVKLTEKMAKDPASRLFVPLAEEYMKCGMTDEAFMVLTDGLKTHPSYIGAHVSLAKLLLQVGKKAEAKVEFEQVVSANPDNVLAHRFLVQLYREEGLLEKALSSCKVILSLNPKDPEMKKAFEELQAETASSSEGKTETPALGNTPYGDVDLSKAQEEVSGEEAPMEAPRNTQPPSSPTENPPINTPVPPLATDPASPDIKPSEVIPQETPLTLTDLKEEIQPNPASSIEGGLPIESNTESSLIASKKPPPPNEEVNSAINPEEDIPLTTFGELETPQTAVAEERPSDPGLSMLPSESVDEISFLDQPERDALQTQENSGFELQTFEEPNASMENESSGLKEAASDVNQGGPPFPPEPQPHGEVGPEGQEEFETESLAELYVRQGYYDKGIKIYEKLLSSDPSNQILKQKLNDAVTLAGLLVGRKQEESRSVGPGKVERVEANKVTNEGLEQNNTVSTPLSQEESQGKSSQTNAKTEKIQRLQAWLANIRKG